MSFLPNAGRTHAPPGRGPLRPTAILALISALLGGCGGTVPGLYRIDIQQGNVLTQEQIAQLEPGMERRKVRFLLGTPLIQDAFNQDRWDYYYSFEGSSGDRVQRRVAVFFEDDRLVRVAGDVTRADGPIVVAERQEELVKVPEGLVDDGIFSGIIPDVFSDRPRLLQPKPELPAEAVAGAAAAAGTAAAAAQTTEAVPPVPVAEVAITEDDTRELTAALAGFGVATSNPPTTPGPAQRTAGEEAEEQEGVLRRWGQRLGIVGEGGSDTSLITPPPEATIQGAEN